MEDRVSRETHAVLVGRRCDDSVNLDLGYLGGLKVCPEYVIIE
jgi:hypothetical protein